MVCAPHWPFFVGSVGSFMALVLMFGFSIGGLGVACFFLGYVAVVDSVDFFLLGGRFGFWIMVGIALHCFSVGVLDGQIPAFVGIFYLS